MNYIIGLIYKLLCLCGCNDFYIGSTTVALNKRFNCHKCAAIRLTNRKSKLYEHMRKVGVDKFQIVLLKKVKFEKEYIEDLRMVETEYYDALSPQLNEYRPFNTEEDKKNLKQEMSKLYRFDKKEHIKIMQSLYHKKNRSIRKKQMNVYYKNNRDKFKKYAQENKEKIDATRKKRIELKNLNELTKTQ